MKHHKSFSEIHSSSLSTAYFLLTYSFSLPCQRAVGGTYILHIGERNKKGNIGLTMGTCSYFSHS